MDALQKISNGQNIECYWQHSQEVWAPSDSVASLLLWFKCHWADEKNYVARENREMTLKFVEALFWERRSQITTEKCKKCIEHVKKVELSYWKTDKIIDQKMDKLEIALDANEDESDIETDSASDEDEQ